MEGYVVGQYKDYLFIFGGSICFKILDNNYQDFFNFDILFIDFNENWASVYINGSYEGSFGEQISVMGLFYY